MRRFIVRFNFSFILIGNRPQSLTDHTAKRYVPFRDSAYLTETVKEWNIKQIKIATG